MEKNTAAWTEKEVRAIAESTAIAVAKNASVAPELCFPHIYLSLKDALASHPAPQAADEGLAVRPSDDELWDKTLKERDDYHDMADKLAEQLAAITATDIGEHTSANNPWENALSGADEYWRLAAPERAAIQTWKDAVLDQCAVAHSAFFDDDPKKTLDTLINWHVEVSHDPAVSERAAIPTAGETNDTGRGLSSCACCGAPEGKWLVAPSSVTSAPERSGKAVDERAAFEAEYSRDAEDEECAAREKNGEYVYEAAWAAWWWWKRGAAYSVASVGNPPDGCVLAPHYRGYANLGTGQYLLNHSAAGEVVSLIISVATDEEKSGRVVGDERANPTDSELQPEAMAVRIDFTNVAGLDALENQLRKLRAEHFTSVKPAEALDTTPNWIECFNKTKDRFPDNEALHHLINLVHFEIRTKEDSNAN